MTPFLAPALLGGAAAVVVPIGLHFLYKPRYRRQPWAAMTFLKLSLEQTSKRVKFQEWVLLALRCLVLILLALALARPVGSAVVGGRGEGVDAVFVFDTSYSLGAADGDQTRLDRLKTAAKAVVDNLPANSTVQVVTCSDRAAAAGPRLPGNLEDAKKAVDAVALTSLAGDVLPGLVEAEAALDRGAGPNKEVYLFTDAQKSGFTRQAAGVRAKAQQLKDRATLLVVRAGDPARPTVNVAVAALTYPGGVPHTKSRLPVTVLVRNTGSAPAKNLTVTLEVDGKDAEKEAAVVEELAPGQAAPVTLTARLDAAGNRVLTARVRSDDLPGDNRLDRVVAVRDAVRVLVVDGRPDPTDPKQSASHFVRNALAPVPADRLADYHVQVTTVTAPDATAGLLGVHDLCVLCDVPAGDAPGALTRAFVTRLGDFVRDGGTLLVGGGEQVLPPAYNAVLGAGGAKLLPADLTDPPKASADAPVKFAPDSADPAGFLARFADEPYRTATADADVTLPLGVGEPAADGRVLLRFATGQPAVVTRRVGAGDVVLVACPLDASGGTWPGKAGSFLAFAQLLLGRVAEKPAEGFNRAAGSPLVWRSPGGDAGAAYELVRPEGARVKLGKPAGDPLAVTAPDAPLAGVYRMTAAGQDPPTGPAFAVTPDLRETEDLSVLTDDGVAEVVGFRPVMLSAGGPGATDYATERSRREWTVWALVAVLAAAAAEAAWAWRCGRAV